MMTEHGKSGLKEANHTNTEPGGSSPAEKIKERNDNNMKRGDIYMADIGIGRGCEQGGKRPVLIIQNNIGNLHSPTVIVAPLTTSKKKKLPTHICFDGFGLRQSSTILCEQIKTVDKMFVGHYIGSVSSEILKKVDEAIMISVGLKEVSR